ncbi:extensin family protein [Myxococcota bacterium]|nr:extensin family protein [Myxococcota bacterium]
MGLRALSTLGLFLLFILGLPAAVSAAKPQPDKRCLSELRTAGVNFKIGPAATGIQTPVTIVDGKIGKLQFMNGNLVAKPHLDCRMALALYRSYPIFSANGSISKVIAGLFYSYRLVKNTNRLSLHASGLAMDIYGVKLEDGSYYSVDSDYEKGLGSGSTCEGSPKTRAGRILRQLACDLDESHFFSAILTPDSDREHQDHFHVSVYGTGEKASRPHRTVLVESQHAASRWVKNHPTSGSPSINRVWKVVTARRRDNVKIARSKRTRGR